MAQSWEAKAASEVVQRSWAVPLAPGDAILTVAAVGSGVTVDSDDYRLGDALVTLSAGTAGATPTVTVTVTTSEGHTHVETFYIAIHATTAEAVTARDVCYFALRKIVGLGEDPDSAELDDALELLRGLLAKHKIGNVPLVAGTALDLPDDFVLPVKYMLRALVHGSYNASLHPTDAMMADEGERHITNMLFETNDLAMPSTLTRRVGEPVTFN